VDRQRFDADPDADAILKLGQVNKIDNFKFTYRYVPYLIGLQQNLVRTFKLCIRHSYVIKTNWTNFICKLDFHVKKVGSGLGSGYDKMMPIRPHPDPDIQHHEIGILP
jgi:hypothetical protein